MRDPHGRFRGRGLVAAAMVLLIVGAGAMLADLRPGSEPAVPAMQNGSTAEPRPAADGERLGAEVGKLREAVEAARSPLGLEQIIAAGDAAARAYAAGLPGAEGNAALVGRRFEVRIPFGCEGPAPQGSSEPLHWTYDAKRETLKLSARPEVWTDAPFAAAMSDSARVEAVEGFWIPRPWLVSEECPPASSRPPDPASLPPPRQSLGLAQYFWPGESRLPQRGGRPYEVVKRAGPETAEIPQGFAMVLRGRIVALPDGQPVRCHGESANHRPICLVSVELDHVAFENPATDQMLGEWRL